jgi:hypothetical protein
MLSYRNATNRGILIKVLLLRIYRNREDSAVIARVIFPKQSPGGKGIASRRLAMTAIWLRLEAAL